MLGDKEAEKRIEDGVRELHEREGKQSEIIIDAVKNPHNYVGCPLCFGKKYISGEGDMVGSQCPKCKGDGIIKITIPSFVPAHDS